MMRAGIKEKCRDRERLLFFSIKSSRTVSNEDHNMN
jgi:hypothetical protein